MAVADRTARPRPALTAGRIDQLHEQGYVRTYLRDGAHEVRFTGNEMAHGDFRATITRADADVLVQLMREVLMEVYQDPGRRERLVHLARHAREARAMADDGFTDEPPWPGTVRISR